MTSNPRVRKLPLASSAGLTVVIGAGGHVGCSVFAAALAAHMSSGSLSPSPPPVLVDADRFAGGLDVLLGMEHAPGARWQAVLRADDDVLAPDVISALPTSPFGFSLLSMDRGRVRVDEKAAHRILGGLASTTQVVVDISRDWDSPIARAAISLRSQLIVVMTTNIRSCAAAMTLLDHLNVDDRTDVDAYTGSSDRGPNQLGAGNDGLEVCAVVREVPSGASMSALRRGMSIPIAARVPHDTRLPRRMAAGSHEVLIARGLQAAAARVVAADHEPGQLANMKRQLTGQRGGRR